MALSEWFFTYKLWLTHLAVCQDCHGMTFGKLNHCRPGKKMYDQVVHALAME